MLEHIQLSAHKDVWIQCAHSLYVMPKEITSLGGNTELALLVICEE